jgi:uncharacterized membrane protein YhaH (DUF805 family)
VIILTIYGFLFIGLPRIRDIGMSGWWLLIMLVPIANIWLGLILLFRAPSMWSSQRPNTALEPTPTAP